jgi:integrase
MASLSTDKNGNRTVRFFNGDKPRRRVKICLGKIGKKTADDIRLRVEKLNAAAIAKLGVDTGTAVWLRDLEPHLYDKLADAGLSLKRKHAQRETLKPFLDAYIASRADVKQSTATVLGHTRRCLIEKFGADKPLAEITPGDADTWRIWLGDKQGLAKNTVNRRCAIARQFFRVAHRRKLIAENPFADMRGVCVVANRSRDHFVSQSDAKKILDACPDAQWRLIFALSRYAGLRCPSEHLALRWGDVDWEHNRMTVRSPKTEHHDGHESRLVPIFPELLPHLDAAYAEAEEGSEFLITRYRDASQNLRTTFEKIIRRAGLTPWPKLFQNLRSTRETELAESFPIHVVCDWIGNSRAVAQKHYLQVTEAHFAQASNIESGPESGPLSGEQSENGRISRIKNPDFSREKRNSPINEAAENGRHRTRTCDFHRVRMAL